MSAKCQTIISFLEQIAPRSLAEDWDNVGLQIGDRAQEVKGILVALDLEPQVVAEALALGANLIVTHHPVILKPLNNLRADTPRGKMILDIVKNGISVYSAHTNLDSARQGVSQVLAEQLGLKELKVLSPDKAENLFKLVFFVPRSHLEPVRSAMTAAGAGWIGNYSDCTFYAEGTGTFKAAEGCSPFIGEVGTIEYAPEFRLETIVTEKQVNKVVKAAIDAHPYEEAAYDIYPLANRTNHLGLGRIGLLPAPVTLEGFMNLVKKSLNVSTLKYTGDSNSSVHRVALCGGSGSSLMHKAVFAGADVFLTGDVKYHEAQEARALGLNMVDAGHFATEFPIVKRLTALLEGYCSDEAYGISVHSATTNSDIFAYY